MKVQYANKVVRITIGNQSEDLNPSAVLMAIKVLAETLLEGATAQNPKISKSGLIIPPDARNN